MHEEDFENLLTAIIDTFPKEGRLLQEEMQRRNCERQSYPGWLSMFAMITRYYFRRRKQAEATAILAFMSAQLAAGSKIVKLAISACYLVDLDIGLDDEDRQWALRLLPENLRLAHPPVMMR